MAAGHGTIFTLVGVPEAWETVAASATVVVALTALGLKVRKDLKNVDEKAIPDGKVSLTNIFVGLVSWLRGQFRDVLGDDFSKYEKILGTIFLMILASNLFGVIPTGKSSTADIGANFAIAIFVALLYHFLGFKEHGFGYLKQFTGGLPGSGHGLVMTIFLSLVAVLLLFIEVVGHVFRPLTLSFRLWGNVNGDHTLVGVFNELTPLFVPIVFLAFGLLVSFIQAFVFTLLSTVYIKLAVSHDH